MNVKVSVIVPAYNGEKYIQAALESVVAQTYQNIEIIAVDDGSTDRTGEIIKSFGEKVICITQENKGLAAARNTGIRHATGEYISFLDADDVYVPEKINSQIIFLRDHPMYDIAYCHMFHFYDQEPEVLYRHKQTCPSGNVFENLLHAFFGQADTLLVPRLVFDEIGLFDEEFTFAEDWEMNIRIAQAGFTFGFMDTPLILMRISSDSWSGLGRQVENKQFQLLIFERLFSRMDPSMKEQYHADNILYRLRFRLVLAYILMRQEERARDQLRMMTRGSIFRISACIGLVAIYIIPIYILYYGVRLAWWYNRRHLLVRAKE